MRKIRIFSFAASSSASCELTLGPWTHRRWHYSKAQTRLCITVMISHIQRICDISRINLMSLCMQYVSLTLYPRVSDLMTTIYRRISKTSTRRGSNTPWISATTRPTTNTRRRSATWIRPSGICSTLGGALRCRRRNGRLAGSTDTARTRGVGALLKGDSSFWSNNFWEVHRKRRNLSTEVPLYLDTRWAVLYKRHGMGRWIWGSCG